MTWRRRSGYTSTHYVGFERLGDLPWVAPTLVAVAAVAADEGRHERALQLLGAAEALWEKMGAPPRAEEVVLSHHVVERARAHLSDASYARWIGTGRSLPVEDAVGIAEKLRATIQDRWSDATAGKNDGGQRHGSPNDTAHPTGSRRVRVIEVRTPGVVCSATDRGAIMFGRSSQCTIKLDADRKDGTLSRFTGVFRREADRWLVDNMSGRLDLTVEIAGGLDGRVQPGAWPFVLPTGSSGIVAIQTTRPYRLEFSVAPDSAGLGDSPLPTLVVNDTETSDMATTLKLNDVDLTMLAAMCEPRLRIPSVGPLSVPTAKVVCARLNITTRRAEDLVDNLVRKFDGVVDGLFGDSKSLSHHRLRLIADFAFRTRCIGVTDLRRLPPPRMP